MRLLDEHGEPVDPTQVDEVAELESPRDRRYLVWVDRTMEERSGAHAFVFFSVSLAAEAARDFERTLSA